MHADPAARRKWVREYYEKNRATIAANSKRWIDRNAVARKAHNLVSAAIRDGKLVKQPCERKGLGMGECSGKIHAHHDDYEKPLEVRWLCVRHHADVHLELRGAAA